MMRSRAFRVSLSVAAVSLVASFASCRTTNPQGASQVKNASQDELPALTMAHMNKAMIDRMVAAVRPDAEAMFGGKANLHVVMLDNVIAGGPCASVLGARIVFANGSGQADASRPYVMATMDPVYFGGESCVYGRQMAPKTNADVAALLAGTRNIDTSISGLSGMNLSIADAFLNVKKSYPTFNSPTLMSVMSSDVPGMQANPWVMFAGLACAEDAVVYVNLTNGSILPGRRPIKTRC